MTPAMGEVRIGTAGWSIPRAMAEGFASEGSLGVLLIQLPPSMMFEASPVGTFFNLLARIYGGKARYGSEISSAQVLSEPR